MEKEITINVIPEDYEGNYEEALGYCWEDFNNKIAGIDIIAKRTNTGIDYVAIAKKTMKAYRADIAYVNCMWCGGFGGLIELNNETKNKDSKETTTTIEEESAQTQIIEKYSDYDKKNHVGWCDKCKTYCYGDCQAN